jgi:hypothetical protein
MTSLLDAMVTIDRAAARKACRLSQTAENLDPARPNFAHISRAFQSKFPFLQVVDEHPKIEFEVNARPDKA